MLKMFKNRADPTPATVNTYKINELARFRIVLGGLGASTCMSTFYGFNIISNHMQTTYGFSSQALTTISTVGIVVGFVTFPGGMLLDYLGPMYVCMCALLLNCLGALLFGLAFDGKIGASVVTFSVFCAIMNLGCASFDTGSLMAVLGSFPRTKGSVVAIMKTFAGIGASIFAVINYSFFNKKYASYMYFMSIVVACAGTIAVIFIRFPPYQIVDFYKARLPQELQIRLRLTEKAYLTQHPPMQRFYYGYAIIVVLVIYLATQSLCVAYAPGITDGKRLGICIGCIVLVFMLPLLAAPFPCFGGMDDTYSADLPVIEAPPDSAGQNTDPYEYINEDEVKVLQMTECEVQEDQNALNDLPAHNTKDTADDDVAKKPSPATNNGQPDAFESPTEMTNFMDETGFDPQYQGTFWVNVRQPDIWLCWWNTLATWGCGVVISFNSAQIYRALNDGQYDIKLNTLYSVFISIGSALGRMSLGIFETWLAGRPMEGRQVITCVYPVSASCMVFGLIFLMALPVKSKAVIIGFFFDSFGNGFSWASTAVTIRSVFAKDIGKHYNFMYLGAFVAVIALNRFAYGELFDNEAKRQSREAIAAGRPDIYPLCAGKKCVLVPFGILLAVNATAIVGSLLCHFRYRKFVLAHRAERKARMAAV